MFDGEVLLVRELVDGAAVARDLDRLEHILSDAVTVSSLLHKGRYRLNMVPALLPGDLREVRRAVVIAARVIELDDDPMGTDLPVVVALSVLVVDEQ